MSGSSSKPDHCSASDSSSHKLPPETNINGPSKGLACHSRRIAAVEIRPEGQQSFFKAVEVSFQSLKPELQDRYKALAVLLEDMAAPLPILQTLWNVSETEARRISRQFVDRSLAQPDGADESIQLHNLQLDYVRAQYLDKEALELIHGAVRMSSHVIVRDPSQFASQMIGRLLPLQEVPAIERFAAKLAEATHTPWLRPPQPALHPAGTALLRILTGHTSSVRAVAVTPDGQRAVSASFDGKLKLLDMGSGHGLRTLTGHRGSVYAVAVTPDELQAVSASEDLTLKLWDLGSGRGLQTLTGHTREVTAVAVTSDGQRAVSASADQTLRVWELGSGREVRNNGSVYAVAVTPDGHHRDVATPGDSASARMGEGLLRFALREMPGAARRAWQLEKERLARFRQTTWSLHNEILQPLLITLALYAVIIAWLGIRVLPFLVLSALCSL